MGKFAKSVALLTLANESDVKSSSVEYLCVELDVRTHSIHDNFLCDGALVTDPEGEGDAASEASCGNHLNRLHHLYHWFPMAAVRVL